jgi:pimeloyl-[acyl-carrier protein] methyl ester esterase
MSEKLKITVRGQGPELVLLHGWAMHSGIWGGLVDVLAAGFRVHLVDLPGHGINRHIPLSRDLDELACMILSSVPQAIWMGWSLGGLVTLAAALAQPEKVQKAILVSATPSFSEQEDWDCGVSVSAQQAFSIGLESDFEETLNQFWLQCFGGTSINESLRLLSKSSITDNVPQKEVLQNGLHLLNDNNLLSDSGKCKIPTLFIGGTRDRTIRPESFPRAAAMMPVGSSSLIRAAGHAPFISHKEKFLNIIHGFLQGEHEVEQTA